jgi:hypothetical protein
MIVRDEAAADIPAIFEITEYVLALPLGSNPARGAVTFHPAFGATS